MSSLRGYLTLNCAVILHQVLIKLNLKSTFINSFDSYLYIHGKNTGHLPTSNFQYQRTAEKNEKEKVKSQLQNKLRT